MTLSLTYDGALSRVQIAGSGLTVIDTFTRTVSNGWGSADSGHAWTTSGGAASDYSVNGSQGIHTHTGVNVGHQSIVNVDVSDVDATCGFVVPVLATGAPIIAGWMGRRIDASNYYLARLDFDTDQSMRITLQKIVAGVFTTIATSANLPFTHSISTTCSLRLRLSGTRIQARAWRTFVDTEPSTWDVDITDTSLTGIGDAGVQTRLLSGNTNTLPVSIRCEDVVVIPRDAPVERSTNQVVWTTVRGGAAMTPLGGVIALDDYEFAADVPNFYRVAGQTNSVTPVLDGVWLKSIARPFLNRKVTVVDHSDVERSSRSGIFPIVGRSLPVAVTDLHGSRRWTLDVLAETAAEAEDLDLLISTGEVQFVHVPAAERVPGGYVALGDTTERRTARRSVRRVFSMALTAAAAPGPDVIPAIGTWQTVFNNYPTWADVLTAHPTWADVLQLAGSPADVVVP